MPSLASKLLQGTAVTTSATIAAFFVWTKHCKSVDLNPATDPLLQSAFYQKCNPSSNPTTHDLCIRRIPIFKLRPDLVEDAEKGGTKMVEAFCAGIWGGFGYASQRHYLASSTKHRNTPTPTPQQHQQQQLWTRPQLLASRYEPGTQITAHFEVLSKTPPPPPPPPPPQDSPHRHHQSTQSILMIRRPSDSEKTTPPTTTTTDVQQQQQQPPASAENRDRDADGGGDRGGSGDMLFEIAAQVDVERGFAEFRLKSIRSRRFAEDEDGGVMMMREGFMWWAQRQSMKLWMESAVRNVRR